MARLLHLAFASVLAANGCASAPADPGPAAPPLSPEPTCVSIDTSAEATISVLDGDGVRVHSFVAPEVASGTATHVIETADALVVVDTHMLRHYAGQFRQYVDSLGKPISHVLVSHAHPDHYFGLESFEDLPTLALAATIEQIEKRGAFHLENHRVNLHECDAVTDRVRLPAQTIEPGELVVGGVTLVLEHVRRAEDNDQLVIRVPAAKVLILQDLMATDTHGFISAGFEEHWVALLEQYRSAEGYEHVLAGHGTPTGIAGITTMIDYVERSAAIVSEAKSRSQFRDAMTAAFPDRSGLYLVDLMAKLLFPR